MSPWLSPLYPALALGALIFAGCLPPGPLQIRLDEDVQRPARSVIVFFPDGLDNTRFHELLDAGRLPHIRKRFVEGGVGVRHAVDSLPSVTYANCSSLVSGLFPGHHEITGNLWFDRRTMDSAHYMTLSTYRTVNDHLKAPTLYDVLGDHFTMNIQLHTYKGVSRSIDGSNTFKRNWILGYYIAVDRAVPERLEHVARIANRVKRWPSAIMTYYPAVDEIGHRYGPQSEEYARIVELLDQAVGRITDAVDRAGLGPITSYVLVSDHGMPPVRDDGHTDLAAWLRDRRGLRVRDTVLDGRSPRSRATTMEEYDAFLIVGADRSATIHLRGRQGWPDRPTTEEVNAFIEAEPQLPAADAVDCVVSRAGPDRVRIRSRRGSAIIERRRENGRKLYRLTEIVGDPLQYGEATESALHHAENRPAGSRSHTDRGTHTDHQAHTGARVDFSLTAFVNAGWHESREWLAATGDTKRPDFVPQIIEMFDSPRMGDVVVFAAEGCDFGWEWRAGHGSCLARDMRIPMYFAGAGLPAGATIDVARNVDLAPTIIGLLGAAQRLANFPPMDGLDLSPQLSRVQPSPQ